MQETYLKLGIVAIALLSNCIAAIFILGKKLSSPDFALRLTETRVSPAKVPLWTGILLVASIVLSVSTHNRWFYLVFALTPVLALTLCKIPPYQFWDIKLKDTLNYISVSLWTLFIILIPLSLITFFSALIAKKLGFDSVQPPIQFLLQSKNIPALIQFLVFAVIIAPALEEMAFRGFLYPLLKNKMGRWGATFFVAFLFALVHLHAPTFIPLFCLGIILITLYEITGSLGYCIALHMLFNGVNCMLLVVARPILAP